MIYMRVRWIHQDQDDPVEIYSELSDARWELRKIEIFRDGRYGYASEEGSLDSMGLSLEKIPSLEEIARDPEFEPETITKKQFESMWVKALESKKPK